MSLTIIIIISLLLIAGYYINQKLNTEATDPPVDVQAIVVDPESGQSIINNELTILASGQDISALVKPYRGVVVLQIKETDTYQVKFPVKNLSELNTIKTELNKMGVTVTYSIVIENNNNTGCFERNDDKVTINFGNCKPCSDTKYVGFGSTHVELLGPLDSKCQMNWGGEVENPNWDGKLVNHCLIPSSLKKLEFEVSNYGVDFSSINQYCKLTK